MRGSSLITGIVILIISVGLATADYVLSERPHLLTLQEELPPPVPDVSASSSSSSSAGMISSSATSSSASMASSISGVVKKGVSTKKATGVDVDLVLAELQLIPQESHEADFLFINAPDRSLVKSAILLRNNDRAFHFSWMETSDVKTIFAALKQSLQEQFSGKVIDLVDETRTPENGPPVDYLSFIDPVLSAERIVFLRVRTRLYEIHVAENGDALLEKFVGELSK